jgi:hypothetical protein
MILLNGYMYFVQRVIGHSKISFARMNGAEGVAPGTIICTHLLPVKCGHHQ